MTRWCALAAAIVFFVLAVTAAAGLIEAELTGAVSYSPPYGSAPAEQVTRLASPEKFNEAVAADGYELLACGALTIASFWIYRRLSN